MNDTLFSQKNMIMAGVAMTTLLLGGYFVYFIFIKDASADIAGIPPNESLLNADINAFLKIKDKLNFKEANFASSSIYKAVYQNDYTETIPDVIEKGRPEPFTPYVTP